VSLIVLIIFVTALWVAFGLPYILQKIERSTVNLQELEMEVGFEQMSIEPSYEPAFYDYYDEDGQIARAEEGSEMYMLIYQSLNRRR